MIKYLINWLIGLVKKTGKRIDFTLENHKVEGYMFTPPVFRNGKLIIFCHGGWGSFPDIPKFKDVDYYVRCGYNVFVLRYDDEFTPALSPGDLNIEKDVADVYYSEMYYRKFFKTIILMGVSRGGFVTLHASIKYAVFDLVIAGCAPSDIEAWDKWGVFDRLIGQAVKPYFYQWPSPIKSAEILAKRPLILIHGMTDDIVPVSQVLNLGRELVKYRTVLVKIFSHRGHALMDDKPVMQYVVYWLDKF
jgi:dipeptidyl aminopeptidase/acylaminoacyl peptidase